MATGRAAEKMGTIYTMSSPSTCSVEQVAKASNGK